MMINDPLFWGVLGTLLDISRAITLWVEKLGSRRPPKERWEASGNAAQIINKRPVTFLTLVWGLNVENIRYFCDGVCVHGWYKDI